MTKSELENLILAIETLWWEDWVQNFYGGVNPIESEVCEISRLLRSYLEKDNVVDIETIRQRSDALLSYAKAS